MKIRTRLLLSLLPAFIGIILFISIEKHSIAILGVSLLVIITMISLYFIVGTISASVQKLNNSALAIAAGQYGKSIEVQGPKELKELSNTLNTMSECLLENINRLKENSYLRERMVGETECARLLQHLMLQKNIDECVSDAIAIKAVTCSSPYPRGLLLDFPYSRPEILNIHLAEAKQDGFDGMYQLLTQYKLFKDKEKLPFPSLRLIINRKSATLMARLTKAAIPYHWSTYHRELLSIKGTRPIHAGDLIFLMNRGCLSFFQEPQKMADLLTKVSKHFAQDGLETMASMLSKEINFAAKRKDLQHDLHLLCIQILKV